VHRDPTIRSRLIVPTRFPTIAALFLTLSVLIMYGSRFIGPSVLQRFDQPKTATYTADIVVNNRWLLPRDMRGHEATKPPLVNWLAAPIVAAGFWTEWAVKLPMTIASLVTLGAVFWFGRKLLGDTPDPTASGIVAAMAWLVNPANVTFVYHCRPDAVLVCLMTLAWITGTCALEGRPPEAFRAAIIFWLCIGLGLLAKGPPALLPVLYVILAARLIHNKWSISKRIGWKWGWIIAAGIALAWYIPVAIYYPDHFRSTFIKKEVLAPLLGMGETFGNRDVSNEGPLLILKTLHSNPVWFLERFAPWSLAAVAALLAIRPRGWMRHPLAPAILWMLLVVACFSLVARKTADYIMPAYPAGAILATWFLLVKMKKWGVTPARVGAAAILLALGLAIDSLFFSKAANEPLGDNLREFALSVMTSRHVPTVRKPIRLGVYEGSVVRSALAQSALDEKVEDALNSGVR
jgi:4-amino-4-deoxy-L-arabinose transferase-like glycosyltransferase